MTFHSSAKLPGSKMEKEQDILETFELSTIDLSKLSDQARMVYKYVAQRKVVNTARILCNIGNPVFVTHKDKDLVIPEQWPYLQGFLFATMDNRAYYELLETLKQNQRFNGFVETDNISDKY